jgi:hypothetical protein
MRSPEFVDASLLAVGMIILGALLATRLALRGHPLAAPASRSITGDLDNLG